MTMGTVSLDEIARDPAKGANLNADAARILHAQCVIVLTALLPALTASAITGPASSTPAKNLNPREASVRFNVSKRWLLAHASEIPGTQKLSRKTIRFDEARLERWLERHRP